MVTAFILFSVKISKLAKKGEINSTLTVDFIDGVSTFHVVFLTSITYLYYLEIFEIVTLNDHLPFIEWHVQFTTIPFKPLLDQGFRRYSYLYGGKLSAKKLRECTLARSVLCTLYTSTESTVYTVTSSLPALNLHLYK